MIQWKPIVRAPFNRDVEIWVTDGVDDYRFGTPCRRTEDGWIISRFRTPLPSRLKPIAWRERE
jgi:hypothetical protein